LTAGEFKALIWDFRLRTGSTKFLIRVPILSSRAFVKLAIARAFRSRATRPGIHSTASQSRWEISEMLISFLMGHSLQGVSAKYTNELMIVNSQALRDAQEKISRRIFELLGLTLGGYHDAPLVPDAPSRAPSTREKSKAAAPARIGATAFQKGGP
jgi:hypothetical protein